MKIPSSIILIIIISLTSALFLLSGLLLLGNSPGSMDIEKGKVLGVSAEVVKNNFGSSVLISNTFPQNDYTYSFPPQKINEAEPIDIDAPSAVVLDSSSNSAIYQKDAQKIISIASITKLMTALVFLDTNPDFESEYTITARDRVEGGKIYLFDGDKVRLKDLFYLSLVGSANTATRALVNSTGMSESDYIRAMNIKADSLGLEKTNFVDPTGLNNYNVSTAKEVAKLAHVALQNKYINEATLTAKYEFETLTGKKKIVYNTDDLLTTFPQNGIKVLGGKTGYIEAAGYCLVGKFTDSAGNEIITAILGSPSQKARFTETKKLAEWAYNSYRW